VVAENYDATRLQPSRQVHARINPNSYAEFHLKLATIFAYTACRLGWSL
jgi:hypothetical protein